MGKTPDAMHIIAQLLNLTHEPFGDVHAVNMSLAWSGAAATNRTVTEEQQDVSTPSAPGGGAGGCTCDAPDWLRTGAELYTQHVHGVASMCVCVLGAMANTLNLIVLTRRELRAAPVNRILGCLALADILLMLEYIPFAFEMYLDHYRARRMFLFPWALFLLIHMHFAQVLHTTSIMLTLLLATWRCLTLAQLTPPSPSRSHINMGRGGPGAVGALQSSRALSVALVLCVVFPVLLCMPSFFCFTVNLVTLQPHNDPRYVIVLSQLAHANGGALYHFQFWFYAVLVKLLPCVLLTALSICLIRALLRANRHSQRLLNRPEIIPMITIEGSSNGTVTATLRSKRATKRTDRTTRMLVAVTLLFLLTEFPQGVLGLLSGIHGPCFFLTCYQLLGDILDMLALLNGAVNFILYCAMSRQFRATFCRLFIPCASCKADNAAAVRDTAIGNTAMETPATTIHAAVPSETTCV